MNSEPISAALPSKKTGAPTSAPTPHWLFHYRRENLPGDILAGAVVAVMLVPQGIAYAMLAGLPPQVGLYVSIIPPLLYGLLGSSPVLAVGPMAIVSLVVGQRIGELVAHLGVPAPPLAQTLAAMVGVILIVLGIFRLGFLVDAINQPVLVGFTDASVLVIALAQLKYLLDVPVPLQHSAYQTLIATLRDVPQTNPVTLGLGLSSIGVLLFFKFRLGELLRKAGAPARLAALLPRAGALAAIIFSTVTVWALHLDTHADVSVVGDVPSGLPPLTVPSLEPSRWADLFPTALVLAFVSYMISISVAKTFANRGRGRIDANRELWALGTANLGAAFTGGYPVAGGFGRSSVNMASGANTGLASVITAGLMTLTVVFLTPFFYHMPKAVLAAVVLVAVSTLFDTQTPPHLWHTCRADAMTLGVTFVAVLGLGIESGIVVGVLFSLPVALWHKSRACRRA